MFSEAYLYHGIGQKGWNYAKHLKSQIHLYQLIPCDKNGKPLEKPELHNDGRTNADFKAREFQFKEAEARVIYQGFTWIKNNGNLNAVYIEHLELGQFIYLTKHKILDDYKTHEDLQRLGVYFTEAKAKEFKII